MILLASDFDETIFFFVDSQKTKKNIEWIQKFISQGNIFCIITGRNYSSIKKHLNEMNIPYTYLICEDGAKIFNSVDYCLDTVYLEPKEIDQVVPILEKNQWEYYLDDGYNQTENKNDCVKIVIPCSEKEEQKRMVETIRKEINVHIYASRNHVNIIHETVNKEKALKKLIELENLESIPVYTIGDNDNDYELIEAFQGVVVKDHHEKLDDLHTKEYENLSEYIQELMKN